MSRHASNSTDGANDECKEQSDELVKEQYEIHYFLNLTCPKPKKTSLLSLSIKSKRVE